MDNNGQTLHLFGWDKKFVLPFIGFVREHFGLEGHHFIIHGPINDGEPPTGPHITHYPSLLKNLPALWAQMRSARKIILHGLFSSHLLYALALHPWVLKKCYWVIWGGDLYIHNVEIKDWRWHKNEWFRRFVIKRIALITTTVSGDYVLACEWYNTKAIFVQNLMYPSHVARIKSVRPSREGKSIIVQIGNSADPSNNHREIIDRLGKMNIDDVQITAPLSYGNMAYANQVVDYGKKKLGENFKPMMQMMPFSAYNDYLQTVDIVIFNHARQQAMGNTIALLSLGKKVYLRGDVTPWPFLKSLGLSVFDSRQAITLSALPEKEKMRNIEICEMEFSMERLKHAWDTVFDYEIKA